MSADNAGMDRTAVLLFNWIEYAVFSTMLVLSLLIGVYYGWFKSQDTVAEYMLGGKKMAVFPVTMSLIFSHLSGVTFLGVPAEIYFYGSQYYATLITTVLMYFIVTELFLPVFYELQLISLYEYLELRFNKTARRIASFTFALSLIVFVPVVIYIPALAFNQVTGISVHVITPVISGICIFYTMFGGLRAVVWTDALQSVFTVGSTVFILCLGVSKLDSISEIIRINSEGHRFELFNLNPSPFERNTIWTIVVGFIFLLSSHFAIHPGAVQRFIAVSTFKEAKAMNPSPFERNTIWTIAVGFIFLHSSVFAIHPGSVQRFIAVSTFKEAKAVMGWAVVGFVVIINLVTCIGFVLYATYHDCDPIATKMVHKPGQILPFYVIQTARDYPGLTGLFISGVLSAALSTMSACLNTVAGTIYEDFIQYMLKNKKVSETQQNFMIKMIVLVIGIFAVLMVFVVEKMGTIFQMAMTLQGLTNGTLLGLFSLGIFFPRANPKGAIVGSTVSMVTTAVVLVGAKYYENNGLLKYPGKITSVAGCPANLTASLGFNASDFVQTWTGPGTPTVADDSVPLIFQLSYMYYCMLGTLTIIVLGLVISCLTEQPEQRCMDPKLFAPPVRRFLPNQHTISTTSTRQPSGDYVLVNTEPNVQELNEINKASNVNGA